jgi:N4-gp56 family major capsid protein
MATGNITVTTAANFIPEIWSSEVKRAVESNLTMGKLVLRRFEGDIKMKGDTVHIADISNLSVNDKSGGSDVSYETITEGQTNISIDKHKYAAFQLEDIVAVQSNTDLLTEYSNKVGYALAKQVDTDLLGLYTALSQSVGTDGTDITAANFLTAIQYLDLADAPETDRSGVFTAGQKKGFLNVDQFVRYDATGIGGQQNPIIRGQFGELYGVRIYFSTNVTTTGSPSGDHNLVFHKEAFALAMQKDIRIQSQYDIDALAEKVVGDVLYGVVEYRDAFGVVVKT